MKILAVLLGLLVVSILLVVGIGAALPKSHSATRTVMLKATPERIFALISGPQDWRTDLKQYKFFDDAGHHMVRETDKNGQTITYELVQSVPPTLLKRTIADKNLPFGGSWTWDIQTAPGGTSVTITEDGEVYNPVFRFISRFILGHTRTIDNCLSMLERASGG